MHTYRVKFYFTSGTDSLDVTMFDRSEDLPDFTKYLTGTDFNSLIKAGSAVVINMHNVTKIEIEEI